MAQLRIGELLVQEALITPSQLQEALTAQQVFGGRLGTNLVEQGFVNEVDLARLLSRQLGIKMVEPRDLARVDKRTLDLIPAELAAKYQVVPFAHDAAKDRVSLAIADPGNLQKADEIQFALGRRVDLFICPEVMLAFALEKHYGVERSRRYIRLSGMAEAELHLRAEDRPKASEPGAPRATAGRLLSPDDMLKRIVDAHTKKDLIAATVDLLATFCGQLVFFVVRGEDLLAWDARGVAAAEEALHAVSLPLAESPLLSAALESCHHQHVPRIEDPRLRQILAGALVADASGGAFVLPLIVNRKGFGAAVMLQLPPDFGTRIPLLVELMKRVSYKLQIFFLHEYLTAPL